MRTQALTKRWLYIGLIYISSRNGQVDVLK